MEEGLSPFAAAVAAAEAELGTAEPSGDEGGQLPSPESQADAPADQAAEVTGTEQPEAEAEPNPLDALLQGEETAQATTIDLNSAEFWDVQIPVTVDGQDSLMTIKDLRDGAMMRADYTRKTQEVAREREKNEKAVDFLRTFEEDPAGFARYLASRAGLITEEQAQTLRGVAVYTDADIEARVQERLDAALAEHPEVQAAQEAASINAVEQTFSAIERNYNVKLSDEHRAGILREAMQRGVTDLDLVFQSQWLRGSQLMEKRAAAKAAAPTGRGGSVAAEASKPLPPPKSVREAAERAMKELSETAV